MAASNEEHLHVQLQFYTVNIKKTKTQNNTKAIKVSKINFPKWINKSQYNNFFQFQFIWIIPYIQITIMHSVWNGILFYCNLKGYLK